MSVFSISAFDFVISLPRGVRSDYSTGDWLNGLEAALGGAKRRYEAHFISKLRPAQSLSARNEFPRWHVRENFGNAGRIFTTGLKAVKIPLTSFRHGNPQC